MIVRLRVGGTTLLARSPGRQPGLALPAKLRPFTASRGGDVVLDVVSEPVPRPPLRQRLFDSGGTWQAFRHGPGLLYSVRSPAWRGPAARGVAIDGDWRRGTLYLPPSPYARLRGFALSYPLDELLLAHHLAHHGGLVLHACALVVGGRAVLFSGSSGAGKTTTARLWRRHRPGVLVLSDDRVVLRRRGGRWWAHGTPWHGSGRFATPLTRPVGAVFFLRQASRTSAVPLSRPAAAARLFSRSFPPPWSAPDLDRTLDTCGRITRRVACYELSFAPDASAVHAVEALFLHK